MEKLLNAYIAKPCIANALKIKAHSIKHPISVCLLTPLECKTLNEAIALIKGLFTRFMPNTPAGEEAWRIRHEANGETVLSIHAANVIQQLRRAGYSVSKAKKAPAWTSADDELLAELGV